MRTNSSGNGLIVEVGYKLDVKESCDIFECLYGKVPRKSSGSSLTGFLYKCSSALSVILSF
jgi:hypothetical protein